MSAMAGNLAGRVVVVGVCGSIAAYKVAMVVRRLRQDDAEVHVLMTPAATQFVGPVTFRALSHHPVITDMWDPHGRWDEPHVALGELADLYLIAPATADTLGRLAGGLAGDIVCATALATRAPILVAPAMSDAMAESRPCRRTWRGCGPAASMWWGRSADRWRRGRLASAGW